GLVRRRERVLLHRHPSWLGWNGEVGYLGRGGVRACGHLLAWRSSICGLRPPVLRPFHRQRCERRYRIREVGLVRPREQIDRERFDEPGVALRGLDWLGRGGIQRERPIHRRRGGGALEREGHVLRQARNHGGRGHEHRLLVPLTERDSPSWD